MLAVAVARPVKWWIHKLCNLYTLVARTRHLYTTVSCRPLMNGAEEVAERGDVASVVAKVSLRVVPEATAALAPHSQTSGRDVSDWVFRDCAALRLRVLGCLPNSSSLAGDSLRRFLEISGLKSESRLRPSSTPRFTISIAFGPDA